MEPQRFSLRRAGVADAEIIARLNEPVQRIHAQGRADFFKPHVVDAALIAWYCDVLVQPDHHVFIAESADTPVGYVYAKVVRRPDGPFVFATDALVIDQISVNEDQRGLGCGKALLGAVYALARAENITRLELNVWNFNAEAIEFYLRQGWRVCTQRMEIQLQPSDLAESLS